MTEGLGLDVRDHIAERQLPHMKHAEVVVAVRTDRGITLYEGIADRIDKERECYHHYLDNMSVMDVEPGYTMTIHFIGSIREGEC